MGGSHDGGVVEVPSWQKSIHLPARLNIQESAALRINNCVAWKWPEEVYELDGMGFFYRRTIHYNPAQLTVPRP